MNPANNPGRPVVFCGVGPALDRIRSEFPDVDVVDITDGVPEDVNGQILFGGMGRPSLEAMGRGVRWVQLAGTGIDHILPEILTAEKVTSARGASAVAISEYVIAAIAAFCRGFPSNWIHEPPPRWNVQPARLMADSSVALRVGGPGRASDRPR